MRVIVDGFDPGNLVEQIGIDPDLSINAE